MAGRIGDDWFGRELRQNLAAAGIDTSLLQHDGTTASGMSVAIVDRQADYGAVVASGANQLLDLEGIALPDGTGLVLLQNEIPEPANIAIAQKARAAGATVVLNAAPMRDMHLSLLACVDILILNRVEASAYFATEEMDYRQIANQMEDRGSGPRWIIVTLGSDGLILHQAHEAPQRHQAFPVKARSTHGAGDHFVGALAAALIAGATVAEAVPYAQAAAALFVESDPSMVGKGPDVTRIETMLAEQSAVPSKSRKQ